MKIINWKLKIILIILAILVLSYVLYSIFYIPYSESPTSTSTPDTIAVINSYQYTEDYSDPTYNFSFKYPDGFSVTAVPSAEGGGGETILVESPDKKIGIQIIISPYGSDIDITEAIIRSDIPNMKVSNSQAVEIGSSRKGLAFISDNPAFNGASREVWFVFKKNLYQISTYAEFDEILKQMFNTWTFF